MEFTAAVVLFFVLTILFVAFKRRKVDRNTIQDWANLVTVSSVISIVIVGLILGISYLIKQLSLTPSPSIVPTSAQDYMYDDFSKAAFDNSYDIQKWFLDIDSGKVFQEAGKLVFQLDGAKGDQISLQATRHKEVPIDSPTFFEAELMVPKAQSGHVYLQVISRQSKVYIDCSAGTSRGAAFGCGYNDNISPIEDYDFFIGDYGTWHTVRIEIEPSTMTITYYVDGREIRSFVPPNAQQLKSENFTFEVGFFGDVPDQEYIAYVDNVRIGKIAQ